jgi:hypothetical protein
MIANSKKLGNVAKHNNSDTSALLQSADIMKSILFGLTRKVYWAQNVSFFSTTFIQNDYHSDKYLACYT